MTRQSLFQAEKQLPQRVSVMPFPTTPYVQNDFYSTTADVFAFIFSFSYLFPAARLIKGIVYEKEAKIREGMRAMGLGGNALMASWYITYYLIVLIQAIFIAAITGRNIFQVWCCVAGLTGRLRVVVGGDSTFGDTLVPRMWVLLPILRGAFGRVPDRSLRRCNAWLDCCDCEA